MLSGFRSLAQSVAAKILIILIILSFALWGIADIFKSSGERYFAKIGDIEISAAEYDNALSQEIARARNIYGAEMANLLRSELANQTMDQIINRELVSLDARDMGILIPDSVVVDRIQKNPMFFDDAGNFSKEVFESNIRMLGESEKSYVEELRKDIAIKTLLDSIVRSINVSNQELKLFSEIANEKRKIALFTVNQEAVNKVPEPTDSELLEYYEKNSEAFVSPELREGTYIHISRDSLTKDSNIAVTEQQVKDEYEARKEEFVRSELRSFKQAVYSSKEAAEKAVAELRAGKNIDELKPDSNENQEDFVIEIKSLHKEDVTPELQGFVFNAKVLDISDPISSSFGWHVIQLTEINPALTTPYEIAKELLTKEIEQSLIEEKIINIIDEIEDKVASGEKIEEVAGSFGIKAKKINMVSKDSKYQDGKFAKVEIGSSDVEKEEAARKIVKTLFSLQLGSNSSVTEISPNNYVVVRLDNISEKRNRALDEVRGVVIERWKAEKRQTMLKQLAESIATGANLESSHNQAGVTKVEATLNRSGEGYAGIINPELIKNAFEKKKGESTRVFESVVKQGVDSSAAKAYSFARVVEIFPAEAVDLSSNSAEKTRRAIVQMRENELINAYLASLRKEYPVEINYNAIRNVAGNNVENEK